jgi:hypothetical protein
VGVDVRDAVFGGRLGRIACDTLGKPVEPVEPVERGGVWTQKRIAPDRIRVASACAIGARCQALR